MPVTVVAHAMPARVITRVTGKRHCRLLLKCIPSIRRSHIMRTTRAIHAVERLKTRSGNPQFAAISLSGGLFYLVDKSSGTDKKVSDPLTLDDFVKFVDGFGPPKPRKASKLDIAFEEQIKKSKGS